MKTPIIDRGSNITYLQQNLLNKMDSEDASRLVDRAKELVTQLPDIGVDGQNPTGLLLGLIQSGKTSALTTGIALAADNGYKMFIVLTTDNNWLYDQTLGRLKNDLQKIQIESKTTLAGTLLWPPALSQNGAGLVLVVSKNFTKLRDLISALEQLKNQLGGKLPNALIIDDEADQASLDTKTSKRAKDPSIQPGPINKLITEVRAKFQSSTYLQVTATPQALFLQDSGTLYRPEFTILVEPGKGYIGGNNFFSFEWGQAEKLIRYIPQAELDVMLTTNSNDAPSSLKQALATFFVGATIKCLLTPNEQLKFSFLCHISQKKSDHQKANDAITSYRQYLLDNIIAGGTQRNVVEAEFQAAYNDLIKTLKADQIPSFQEVFDSFSEFINGMEIQVLNSDKEAAAPKYDRRSDYTTQ